MAFYPSFCCLLAGLCVAFPGQRRENCPQPSAEKGEPRKPSGPCDRWDMVHNFILILNPSVRNCAKKVASSVRRSRRESTWTNSTGQMLRTKCYGPSHVGILRASPWRNALGPKKVNHVSALAQATDVVGCTSSP